MKNVILAVIISTITILLGIVIATSILDKQINKNIYDINKDGKVTITDVVLVNKYSLEQENKTCDKPIISTSEDGIVSVVC